MKNHNMCCGHFLKAREKVDLCQDLLSDYELYAMLQCQCLEVLESTSHKLTRSGLPKCTPPLLEGISDASKLSRNDHSDLVPCLLPGIRNPMNINLFRSRDGQLF
jgi:hypothetical protein